MRPDLAKTLPRVGAEFALLVAAGLFMGALGPYGTDILRGGQRYAYWLLCIVGGGAIGIAIDEALARRAGSFWRRLAASSVLMTPAVTGLVVLVGRLVIGPAQRPPALATLIWQVFVVSAAVMAVRALVWRRGPVVVETRTVVAPPLPEAEAAFRRRLSARRRGARLIAIEADDHYLKVHTDAGVELVTLRLADALDELSGAHGFQVHRSWWVAAEAIEAVRWRRGAGEAQLAGGLVAPVSRTYRPALKAAGWF
jgi:LytTr DNA-binding domain